MTRLVSLLGVLFVALAPAAPPAHAAPAGWTVRRVAGFEFAVGMQWTKSGDRLFVNERSGRVRVLTGAGLRPEPVATVATTTRAEGGLLGLALHPRFEDGEPWLYVFYTQPNGREDVVERMRIENDRATERQIVLRGMPAGAYHHGGSLVFGPDGKLYISNGEAHNRDRAQNPRVLGGKIYRVNPDGSVPNDNPFGTSRAFAIGLRNPFGMALDPESGLLWVTENGPTDHDEVNVIERGKNYGWPRVKGIANDRRFVDPVRDYVRIIVPTMGAFGGDVLPDGFRGSFFFGSYRDNTIRMLTPTADRRGVARESTFHTADAPVVGVASGPDALYYSTPGALWRIAPPPTPTPTPSTPTPSTPTPSTPAPSTPASTAPPSAASPRDERDAGGVPAGALAVLGIVVAGGLAVAIALAVRRRG